MKTNIIINLSNLRDLLRQQYVLTFFIEDNILVISPRNNTINLNKTPVESYSCYLNNNLIDKNTLIKFFLSLECNYICNDLSLLIGPQTVETLICGYFTTLRKYLIDIRSIEQSYHLFNLLVKYESNDGAIYSYPATISGGKKLFCH